MTPTRSIEIPCPTQKGMCRKTCPMYIRCALQEYDNGAMFQRAWGTERPGPRCPWYKKED